MLTTKKVLQMTSLLFGMTLLFCYISWSLGYEGFIIVGDINLPWILSYAICFSLFTINMALQAGFIMDWYNWKVLYFAIPLAICNGIGSLFLPPIIFTGILPYILFIFAAVKKHGLIKKALRPFILLLVIFAHQFMVSLVYDIGLKIHISMYQVLRISLSEILLMILIFSIGGVLHVDSAHRLELLVFPGRIVNDQSRNGSCQADAQDPEDVPVNPFEKWVMRSVIMVVQIAQWMFILWICSLDNLFLDALVITTSFICHGLIITTRKHIKSIVLCTLAATLMFYLAAKFTFSFQYSHFFPIFIGLVLVYTMYRISYELDIYVERRAMQKLHRIEELEKKVEEAWDEFDQLM